MTENPLAVRFWAIESREFGLFCGFKRKAKDFWQKRATFSKPGDEGKVMIFDDDQKAYRYIRGHLTLPGDCTVRLCSFDVEYDIYFVNEGERRHTR